MGTAYFIVTESEVPGYDPVAIEGKMVSRLDGLLDEGGFYAARGVKPLYEFCGDDMSEFLDEDMDDELDEEAGGERWFDAAEGLATVRCRRGSGDPCRQPAGARSRRGGSGALRRRTRALRLPRHPLVPLHRHLSRPVGR